MFATAALSALLMTYGAAALLAPVSLASRDPLLTPDGSARNVTAYAGLVAWSRMDAQQQAHLVLRTGGITADLPVAPSPSAFEPTLGPGTDGHPTLVYARREGATATLERFDTVTGVESAAAAPQAVGRHCDVIGAVSGDVLAYALPCQSLLRVVTADGRVLLTRQGIKASGIGLSPSNLAVTYGDWTAIVRVINLTTNRSFVAGRFDRGAVGGAGDATWPSFVDGSLYFAGWYINASGTSGGTLGPFRLTPGRRVSCAPSRRHFGTDLLMASLAVDPPNAYYGDGDHLYQTTSASLRFRAPRKGSCGPA